MGLTKPTSTPLPFSIFTPLFSHKLDALRSVMWQCSTFKIGQPVKTTWAQSPLKNLSQ